MDTLKELLLNKNKNCNSIWFMRQAGRYLPEFRKIRAQNPNFINLCLNSELSAEITLQPIQKFNLDSAIIFSDILLVPYALGQDVVFTKGKSPTLSEFNYKKFKNNKKNNFSKILHPVYEAIRITRKKLDKKKSLICFVGAPWTLITYMLYSKKKKEEINYYSLKEQDNYINDIVCEINDYLCTHISNQINAGADVVQVFDSWAGLIPENHLIDLCFKPNKKIVQFCKNNNVPIICFPKGIKENYLNFNKYVKPDGLNLDYEIDPNWAKKNLSGTTLQGGMNPKYLLGSEDEMINQAKKYLDAFKNTPYIFNLGHGLLPETDPENLKKLINFVRNYR